MPNNNAKIRKSSDIERDIVQHIGMLTKNLGIGELVGLLLGTLLLHKDEPVSLEYLTEVSRYSKSSVSMTMKTLSGLGLFDTVKIEGDRRRYYMIKGKFRDILLKYMLEIIEIEIRPMLNLLNEHIPELERLSHHASTKREQEKARNLLDKVKQIRDEYEDLLHFILYLSECAENFAKNHT